MTQEVVSRVDELKKLCASRFLTVAVAESCTGGLLSSWVTSQPGVSSFFLGGVVSYARSVKERALGVSSTILKSHGEVSLATARAMAAGARQKLGADWAIGITGVAGPSGGSVDKPVGFVCFAVAGPGFEKAVHKQFEASRGREDIQRQAALFAFDFLLNAMR